MKNRQIDVNIKKFLSSLSNGTRPLEEFEETYKYYNIKQNYNIRSSKDIYEIRFKKDFQIVESAMLNLPMQDHKMDIEIHKALNI